MNLQVPQAFESSKSVMVKTRQSSVTSETPATARKQSCASVTTPYISKTLWYGCPYRNHSFRSYYQCTSVL